MDREYSCDLANSRDHGWGGGRKEGSQSREFVPHRAASVSSEITENVSEDSGVRGQDSRASTPVEKPKSVRVSSQVAVKVKNRLLRRIPGCSAVRTTTDPIDSLMCVFSHFDGVEKNISSFLSQPSVRKKHLLARNKVCERREKSTLPPLLVQITSRLCGGGRAASSN